MATAVAAAIAAAALAAAAAHARAPEGPARGLYAEGKGGVAWFIPCGAGKRLELADSDGARELRTLFAQLGGGRARSIFVEVSGRREGDGFHVAAVHRAQFGGLGCSEDLRRVVAKGGGHDPSWSLVFDDARLVFQRVGDRMPAAFPPLGAFVERNGRREFRGETETARIYVVLRRQRCEDQFANAVLSHVAEVEFAWSADRAPRQYRGCAYLGDAAR